MAELGGCGVPQTRGATPARGPAFWKRRRIRSRKGKQPMDDHVYKIIELATSSTESIDDAIRKGVGRASETLEHLRWFEVKELRGHIEGGEVAHFQVVLRIGFTLNEP
jgi:dodecin